MTDAEPEKHLLEGFPAAALNLFRVLEKNRSRIAERHGLSEIELRALFRVAEAGVITPKKLAADLGLTNGAITGISTRMVAAGHIGRVSNLQDRRSFHLELTTAGHTAVRGMHTELRDMLSPDSTTFPEEEIAITVAVLESMTERVRSLAL